MRYLQQKLSIARGEEPAELLFKNARLVNVLSGEVYPANVAVADGRVVGIGDYEAREVIDLNGACLAPSLIDGHFHVESSMLTMPEFVRAVTPHGTGAVVIDPEAGLGRVVVGAVEAAPVVMKDARVLFGGAIGPSFAQRFDAAAADALLAAAGMSDPIDRHVHVTVLRRAIVQAGQGTKVRDAA